MKKFGYFFIVLPLFFISIQSVQGQILKELLKEAASEAIKTTFEEATEDNSEDPVRKSGGQKANIKRNVKKPRPVNYTKTDVEKYEDYGWNPYKYSDISNYSKEYVFVDEFEDNSNKWVLRDNFKETARITNGKFIIASNGSNSVGKSLAVNVDASNNFEIEAKIKFLNGNPNAANYFTWGKSPFGAYEFGFSGDGKAYTYDKFKNTYKPMISWTKTDHLNPSGEFNKLTIRKVDDNYFFFINEHLVNTYPFNSFFGRYLGFVVPPDNKVAVDFVTVANLKKSELKERIQRRVTRKVEEWQKKGEYEKTAHYKKRVTPENRQKKVEEFTQQTINELAREKLDYSTCSSEYDADNEVFKLDYDNFSPVYLPVPIDEAPAFDDNIEEVKYDSTRFTITNKSSFAILYLEVTNPANGKTYTYNSESQTAFNSNDLQLDYDSVEVNIPDEEVARNEKDKDNEPKKRVKKPEVDVNIPETNAEKENTYALVIGNEDYSSYQTDLNSEVNVDYAENDARVFKEYLVKTLGVQDKNISLLINATLGQMQQALNKMNEIAEVTDGKANFIFYYSGHGLPDEQTKEPYIMPVDISGANIEAAIKLPKVYNTLTEHPHNRVTVFLDACFSGGARDEPLIAMKGVKIKPKKSYLNGNFVAFTSSSGRQSSNVFREKRHGLFTYFLLKKLNKTAGNVTYGELGEYLIDKVKLESVVTLEKKQTPEVQYSPEIRDEWEDWEF